MALLNSNNRRSWLPWVKRDHKMNNAEATSWLSQFIGKNLRIHASDGRVFGGQMKCTDKVSKVLSFSSCSSSGFSSIRQDGASSRLSHSHVHFTSSIIINSNIKSPISSLLLFNMASLDLLATHISHYRPGLFNPSFSDLRIGPQHHPSSSPRVPCPFSRSHPQGRRGVRKPFSKSPLEQPLRRSSRRTRRAHHQDRI